VLVHIIIYTNYNYIICRHCKSFFRNKIGLWAYVWGLKLWSTIKFHFLRNKFQNLKIDCNDFVCVDYNRHFIWEKCYQMFECRFYKHFIWKFVWPKNSNLIMIYAMTQMVFNVVIFLADVTMILHYLICFMKDAIFYIIATLI